MTGKILALSLVLAAAIAGGSLYYLQVYAYYDEVTEEQAGGVTLVAGAIGKPIKIVYSDFQAIDSDSSPLRFRACFNVKNSLGMLTENFRVYDDPVPNMAPGWFDCFDAKARLLKRAWPSPSWARKTSTMALTASWRFCPMAGALLGIRSTTAARSSLTAIPRPKAARPSRKDCNNARSSD